MTTTHNNREAPDRGWGQSTRPWGRSGAARQNARLFFGSRLGQCCAIPVHVGEVEDMRLFSRDEVRRAYSFVMLECGVFDEYCI